MLTSELVKIIEPKATEDSPAINLQSVTIKDKDEEAASSITGATEPVIAEGPMNHKTHVSPLTGSFCPQAAQAHWLMSLSSVALDATIVKNCLK